MHRGHGAAFDHQALAQYVQKQAQCGGRGRGGGDHPIAPVRGIAVDLGDHDAVDVIPRQGADQHPRRAAVEVRLHMRLAAIHPGGVDYQIDGEDVPGHFQRFIDAHKARALIVRDQEVAL